LVILIVILGVVEEFVAMKTDVSTMLNMTALFKELLLGHPLFIEIK